MAPGTVANSFLRHSGVGLSFLGSTQAGVRWNTVRCSVSWAMIGMNWIALAPVPMTTTFLPFRSIEWSHWAEWKRGPSNVSAPAISGMLGMCSPPTPAITTRAS